MSPKRVYVGPCGQVVSWKKLPELYSALEINQTFYRFPTERQIQNWQKALQQGGASRRNFRLIIKAFQGLTHPLRSPTWKRSGLKPEERAQLKDWVGCLRINPVTQEFWARTCALAQTLKAHYVLLQLPSWCAKEEENLFRFFNSLGQEASFGLGLEIRWSAPHLLLALWERYGLTPVFDPFLEPGLYELFTPRAKTLYFRLHGQRDSRGRLNYRYQYEDSQLKRLAEMIKACAAEEVLVLFNNTYMKEDALRFLKLLSV